MTVRDANPQDAAEVAGVHVRSWQAAYRGLFPDDYLDGLRADDRMAHYTFGDGRPVTIVAVAGDTICRTVRLRPRCQLVSAGWLTQSRRGHYGVPPARSAPATRPWPPAPPSSPGTTNARA